MYWVYWVFRKLFHSRPAQSVWFDSLSIRGILLVIAGWAVLRQTHTGVLCRVSLCVHILLSQCLQTSWLRDKALWPGIHPGLPFSPHPALPLSFFFFSAPHSLPNILLFLHICTKQCGNARDAKLKRGVFPLDSSGKNDASYKRLMETHFPDKQWQCRTCFLFLFFSSSSSPLLQQEQDVVRTRQNKGSWQNPAVFFRC